jgi:hypothetical protein
LSLDSLFRGKAYTNNHQVEQNPIIIQKHRVKNLGEKVQRLFAWQGMG